MSFLDDWKQKRVDKKIEKHAQYLTKKTTSRNSRAQSIEILKEIGSEEAIAGLLQRFRLTVPELTPDEEEKEYVSNLIRGYGKKAVKPLIDFIDQYDQVMLPLKILAEILPEDRIITILMDKIKGMDEIYSNMKTIKLVEILLHLSRYKSANLVDVALKFLDPDDDDEVNLAAIQLLEKQADERSREPLLDLAAHPDTTQRILYRIAELFVTLQWSIKGSTERKQLEAKLKPEFYVIRGGFLKQRGN